MIKTRLLFLKLQLYPAPYVIENAMQKVLDQREDIETLSIDCHALLSHFSQKALAQNIHYSYLAGLIPKICAAEKIDAVLFLEGFWLNVQPTLYILHKMGVKTIGWMTDDPYNVEDRAKIIPYLDTIFTVDSSVLDFYKQLNPNALVQMLPLGCLPGYVTRDSEASEFEWEISMVGVPHPDSTRVKMVDQIASYLSSKKAVIAGAIQPLFWKTSLSNPELLANQILDRWVPAEETLNYYKKSKINIVIHRDNHSKPIVIEGFPDYRFEAQSPCERVFNIAAAGGFQIVDDSRPDLKDFFEPGKEIVTFSDPRDLEKKCEYYLKHEEERMAIASAGKKRAENYSYTRQIDTLFKYLSNRL